MSELMREMVGAGLSMSGLMFAIGGWLHWDNPWITFLGGCLFGIGYTMAWRGDRGGVR